MMTNVNKRLIENVMVQEINMHPNGIDTRALISQVINSIASSVPNVNRHHIAGMLAWVLRKYNYSLLVRTPGYSVIA